MTTKLPKMRLGERIDSVMVEDPLRPYLGGSQLAHPCKRYLMYSFRWMYDRQVPARINRIFRMGDYVETAIIDALATVGIRITDDQLTVHGYADHGKGHIDGLATNVPDFDPEEILLFEAKSMKHSIFLECKRKGVQATKPVYYGQLNTYMGRLNLSYALFAFMDKDTCEIEFEFVPFDVDNFEESEETEKAVIEAVSIEQFRKIGKNQSWYQCKMCDAKDVCHNGLPPSKNCRTCSYVDIHDQGRWYCNRHETFLTEQSQRMGCADYDVDLQLLGE